jgi:hypothetical protein
MPRASTSSILVTGYQRDTCVVAAHAAKSRALMAIKAEG